MKQKAMKKSAHMKLDNESFMKKNMHQQRKRRTVQPVNLQTNIQTIKEQLSLNAIESSILTFTVLLYAELMLEECLTPWSGVCALKSSFEMHETREY